MTNEEFQRWLAGVEQLTVAQRERLQQVAQEQGDEAASLAAIELRVDARRRCPRCGAGGAVRRGCANRLRRYACKACRRTFHALTGTPLAGLRHRERWRACGRALVARESVRKAAERCGVAPSTAFRWRHRCVAQAGEPGGPLAGLVEADETCFRHSRKGERNLNRKPRRRGGPARRRGLSREPVPVLVATARGGGTAGAVLETASQANLQAALEPLLASDAGTGCPGCARSLGVQHEAVNRAAGQRLRGSHPIQTVNQRHRQLQQFPLPFHGVATKCRGNHLRWHQEIGLASQPSPRACLPASLAPQCTRFAN